MRIKRGTSRVDSAKVNTDDFYAAPVTPAAPAVVAPLFTPVPLPPRPTAKASFPLWPVVGGIVATLALLIGLAVALWPHSSGPSGPDTGTARLFGQQTRLQLPQPVQADDCAGAVRAFPAIARDQAAKAAFIDGCLHP